MNPVFRFATVQGQSFQWFLRRNCSVTPRQLAWIYLSLCAVSLGLGVMFWLLGATLVLPIAWLELSERKQRGAMVDDCVVGSRQDSASGAFCAA